MSPHPSSLIPHPSSLIPSLPSHKGFTLVELLVVIGIIGILVGVLLGTFSGSTESARAARCLTNMKNLANAIQNYGMDVGSFPPAASYEYSNADVSGGLANVKVRYHERPGWISWYSKGLYPSDSSQESSCRTIGLYSDVPDDYNFAIENGAAYANLGKNASAYVCPSHKDKYATARWSYFMNPNAGGASLGKKIKIEVEPEVVKFRNADRVLLFGEIPFLKKQGPGDWFPGVNEEGKTDPTGNDETDAVIQFDKENIGANHKSGKIWVAHVAFADGHVEKLRVSSSGGKVMSGSDLRELTEWLCKGEDISFNGQTYEKLTE